MREKIEAAKMQAIAARNRALACVDPRMKSEWEMVASLWEELAVEYGELEKARIHDDPSRAFQA